MTINGHKVENYMGDMREKCSVDFYGCRERKTVYATPVLNDNGHRYRRYFVRYRNECGDMVGQEVYKLSCYEFTADETNENITDTLS